MVGKGENASSQHFPVFLNVYKGTFPSALFNPLPHKIFDLPITKVFVWEILNMA